MAQWLVARTHMQVDAQVKLKSADSFTKKKYEPLQRAPCCLRDATKLVHWLTLLLNMTRKTSLLITNLLQQ